MWPKTHYNSEIHFPREPDRATNNIYLLYIFANIYCKRIEFARTAGWIALTNFKAIMIKKYIYIQQHTIGSRVGTFGFGF